MKFAAFAASACLAIAAGATAADKQGHAHDHKPLHGGIVVETKAMDLELVAKVDVIQLYLRDHGKAVDASKATAKVTLLTGSDKRDVELKPAGDRLEARGAFRVAAGTKAVAVVTFDGKASTARFVNK